MSFNCDYLFPAPNIRKQYTMDVEILTVPYPFYSHIYKSVNQISAQNAYFAQRVKKLSCFMIICLKTDNIYQLSTTICNETLDRYT